MHRLAFALLVAAACGSSPAPKPAASPPPPASKKLDEASAILAVSKLGGSDCVSYVVDESTADGFVIAQREAHGGSCGGDPETAPVRARYRIDNDGHISKYDPVEDKWSPAN